MAMATRAMATAMGRGDTATGPMASMPTATVLTRAAVLTPTSTAPACAGTGAFGLAPNSHCGGGYATASRHESGVHDVVQDKEGGSRRQPETRISDILEPIDRGTELKT